MIKKIIEKIKSWFRPKEQMDPHEVMLHPKRIHLCKMNKMLYTNCCPKKYV